MASLKSSPSCQVSLFASHNNDSGFNDFFIKNFSPSPIRNTESNANAKSVLKNKHY